MDKPSALTTFLPGRPVQAGMRYLTVLTLLLAQALSGRAQAQSDVNGTWTAELRNAKMFLQVRTAPPKEWNGDRWNGDWSIGQSFPIEERAGIPPNDEQFSVTNIKFDLHREAGTLAFEGAFRDGRGAGLFRFSPRVQYTVEMKTLGYNEDLPPWRRFQLAIHDVGPKYVKELKTEGYDKLSLDQIQRAKTHGVTIEYIRDLKGQGFRTVALESLVRTRDHGVTAEYIKALKAEGYTSASLDQFVRLRDHGVRAAFVQELKAAGYDKLGAEDLVRLHDHGVTAGFVRDLAAQGFKNIALEDVVRTRDRGVSAEFVADMKELGFKDLTLQQIIRLRDHGITPGFVNHARARGFKQADVDELVRLKNGGL